MQEQVTCGNFVQRELKRSILKFDWSQDTHSPKTNFFQETWIGTPNK